MAQQKKQWIEGGGPVSNPKAFRRALGNYPTGVTVVTSLHTGRPVGVTANSFSSVSLDPPLVLWSIAHTSRSYGVFQECEHFAISVLADDQISVSQALSSSSDDKFESVSWTRGKTGSPLIDHAIAYFDCVCEARHEGGDHTILVGRVVDFGRYEGEPLVFAQGRYGVAFDHPSLQSRFIAEKKAEGLLGELPLLSLLAKVHYKVDLEVEERRLEGGLTATGSKVLAGLYGMRPMGAQELANRMYLDVRAVEDVLAEFVASGDVERLGDGSFTLTDAGKERRRSIWIYLAEYQAERLAGVSASELASARRVLEKLFGSESDSLSR